MRSTLAALLVASLAAAGCSSSDEKPQGGNTTATTDAPATREVKLVVTNDVKEPRVVWVETYHPEKGRMSGSPDAIVQLGILAPGDTVTKTLPVALGGWYRAIGAKQMEGEKDKVLFMGAFSKIRDGEEPPIKVNR